MFLGVPISIIVMFFGCFNLGSLTVNLFRNFSESLITFRSIFQNINAILNREQPTRLKRSIASSALSKTKHKNSFANFLEKNPPIFCYIIQYLNDIEIAPANTAHFPLDARAAQGRINVTRSLIGTTISFRKGQFKKY